MTKAATVASAMVETVAMRRPAAIAGRASGNSTDAGSPAATHPIPRAASITSGGAARSPATMLRKRISSV